MEPSLRVLVCAPLAIERLALGTSPHLRVVRTGMGEDRSRRAARAIAHEPARAVIVAGFGGALDPALEPGDVVVADAVSGPRGRSSCESSSLAGALRAAGLRVTVGTIACRDHLIHNEERRALFEQGACAADMESVWLAAAASGRPFGVVRAVVDTPRREITRVIRTVLGGARAYASLVRVGRALASWAADPSF